MTRHDLPTGQRDTVTVYGSRKTPHSTPVASPEDPGDYAFPPIAGAITGARLMLAILEKVITDAGGSYAFCDTDSMAIIATSTGGLMPCPGGAERLNGQQRPARSRNDKYTRSASALTSSTRTRTRPAPTRSSNSKTNYEDPKTHKRRRQLWCYAISAKRYVLYNHDRKGHPTVCGHTALDDHSTENPGDDEPALRKPSEHGLGYLLHPTDPENEDRDWIREAWEHILRTHLHLPVPEPD